MTWAEVAVEGPNAPGLGHTRPEANVTSVYHARNVWRTEKMKQNVRGYRRMQRRTEGRRREEVGQVKGQLEMDEGHDGAPPPPPSLTSSSSSSQSSQIHNQAEQGLRITVRTRLSILITYAFNQRLLPIPIRSVKACISCPPSAPRYATVAAFFHALTRCCVIDTAWFGNVCSPSVLPNLCYSSHHEVAVG